MDNIHKWLRNMLLDSVACGCWAVVTVTVTLSPPTEADVKQFSPFLPEQSEIIITYILNSKFSATGSTLNKNHSLWMYRILTRTASRLWLQMERWWCDGYIRIYPRSSYFWSGSLPNQSRTPFLPKDGTLRRVEIHMKWICTEIELKSVTAAHPPLVNHSLTHSHHPPLLLSCHLHSPAETIYLLMSNGWWHMKNGTRIFLFNPFWFDFCVSPIHSFIRYLQFRFLWYNINIYVFQDVIQLIKEENSMSIAWQTQPPI